MVVWIVKVQCVRNCPSKNQNRVGRPNIQVPAAKLSYNEQKEYKNLESKIRSLELDKKAMEAKFNNPDLSQDDINKLSAELQVIIDTIEEKELRWFELAERLEE